MRYLLGYDLGTSSVKASLLDVESGKTVAEVSAPDHEMRISALSPGWAEQDPEEWWHEVIHATIQLKKTFPFDPSLIAGIGIAYQMHGLVLLDRNGQVIRPSIIWCDSRAVTQGERAYQALGSQYCLAHLLNAPGNFTASKLFWVKENEPAIFDRVHVMMLPGDYIAYRMSGEMNTTISGLSEGILWDFKQHGPAYDLLDYCGIPSGFLPALAPTFGFQGALSVLAADALGLKAGTPITYRAGDQPNNAFSLNVLETGEVAANAGTSGVVYGINEQVSYDPKSRVNTFAHVNYQQDVPRLGVLLCVNGTGISNSWMQKISGQKGYPQMNELGSQVPVGAEGLYWLPFGNGAERMLENQNRGAQLSGLHFNRHQEGHLFRAVQEGIAFSLAYGLDIMEQMGVPVQTVRAGYANLFLSPLFREAFSNTTGTVLELYHTQGSQGAARGAGIGAGVYKNFGEAFHGLELLRVAEPDVSLRQQYQEAYQNWLGVFKQYLK